MTLRGVDPELEARLRKLAKQSSRSLNATVLDLLRRALGLTGRRVPYTDLDDLAGGWSEQDLGQFRDRTRAFDQVDEDLWR